jgi:hypothetical protein
MPVVIEYQNFPTLGYDWTSNNAASAPLQIDVKLKAWVAAVNANSGNSAKQITVLRDIASSTGTRRGWLLRFTDGVGPGFIFQFANTIAAGNSGGGARCDVCPQSGWTNNTDNDGYGAITSQLFIESSIGWYMSGTQAEFIIASSADANQEFFILGWNMANSTSYRDCLAFFKDTNNRWVGFIARSSLRRGCVQNPELGLQSFSGIQSAPITSPAQLVKLCFTGNTGTYSPGTDSTNLLVYPAHPKLWMSSSATSFNFGGYYAANGRVFFGLAQYDWVLETT